MRQIVVSVQPFDWQQKIYEFEGHKLVVELTSSIEELPERIVKLCASDEVTDVTIQGAIDFTAKIKENMRSFEIAHYGQKTLDVKLVP